MEHFIELQLAVTSALNETFNAARRHLRVGSSLISLYSGMSIVLYLVVFALMLLPQIWVLARYIGTVALGMGGNEAWTVMLFLGSILFSAVCFALWLGVTAYPFSLIARRLPKTAYRAIQSLVVIPLSLIATNELMGYLIGMPVQSLEQSRITMIVLLLFVILFALTLTGLIVFIGSSLSGFLLFLLAGPVSRNTSMILPTHDDLTMQAMSRSAEFMTQWDEETIRRIDEVAGYKLESLAAQVQAVAPILGAIGLIGLFALVITQEQIRAAIQSFNDFIQQTSGSSGHIDIGGVLLAFLGLIVYMGCFYFARTYHMMRVLEIIRILCGVRLAELRQEKETAQRAAALALIQPKPSLRLRDYLADWIRGR